MRHLMLALACTALLAVSASGCADAADVNQGGDGLLLGAETCDDGITEPGDGEIKCSN